MLATQLVRVDRDRLAGSAAAGFVGAAQSRASLDAPAQPEPSLLMCILCLRGERGDDEREVNAEAHEREADDGPDDPPAARTRVG
jgi:hypothetical protein